MQLGMFFELQLPRPWAAGDEQKLFRNALEWAEIGERIGIDYAWDQEHHFLEEYSHSTAPEVFLAARQPAHQAASASGHGIMPDAARATTTRPASPSGSPRSTWSRDGRVEFGTGESQLGGRARRVRRRPRREARHVGRGPRRGRQDA